MSQISPCSLWCLKAVNPGLKSIISSAYSWQYFPCVWNCPHQYICSEMHSENTMKDWCCLSNPLHYMYHESIKKHFKYQTSLRLEMSFRFESDLNQTWIRLESDLNQTWIRFELDLEGTIISLSNFETEKVWFRSKSNPYLLYSSNLGPYIIEIYIKSYWSLNSGLNQGALKSNMS